MTIESVGCALPLLSDLAGRVAIGRGSDRCLEAELVAQRRVTHQVEQKGERRAGVAYRARIACHGRVSKGWDAATTQTQFKV
jgi:hypothetical protein